MILKSRYERSPTWFRHFMSFVSWQYATPVLWLYDALFSLSPPDITRSHSAWSIWWLDAPYFRVLSVTSLYLKLKISLPKSNPLLLSHSHCAFAHSWLLIYANDLCAMFTLKKKKKRKKQKNHSQFSSKKESQNGMKKTFLKSHSPIECLVAIPLISWWEEMTEW